MPAPTYVDVDALHPAVQAGLGALHDGWRVMACDPHLADTEQFCAAYGIAHEDSANAIVAWGKSDPAVYAVCMVLATQRLDVNKTVRKKLGARKASFAPFDVGVELSGMESGGITPVGFPARDDGSPMPIWIDPAVMARDEVVIGGGNRSSKLVLPPKLLLDLPGAEIVEGLAKPAE